MSDPLDLCRSRILDQSSFAKAVFTGPDDPALVWRKVLIRPVELKNGFRWQVSRFDERKDITKNYDAGDFPLVLTEILGLRFRNITVEAGGTTLTLTRKAKEKFLVRETRHPGEVAPPVLGHDKKKPALLDPNGPPPFLRALDFLTEKGEVRSDMRDKFRQINEFLRILDETGVFRNQAEGFSVVDFGCGNAYLTFALHHHLANTLNLAPRITGVDLKADLMARLRAKADGLGWAGLDFVPGTIGDYARDTPPDAVVALHACDTATDDALARGIAWGSSLIVVAPCCQHELQVQLASATHPGGAAGLFRYGLVSERLGDLLTDTFRALQLRMAGYSTDILQFVDSSHTPKNLMIRAVKTAAPVPKAVTEEYQALKDYWGVTPYLERRLAETTDLVPPSLPLAKRVPLRT